MDRVWPLYVFFAVGLIAMLYLLVVQGPNPMDGQARLIVVVVIALSAIPGMIGGIVLIRRYSRSE
jgi:hypothetical protein